MKIWKISFSIGILLAVIASWNTLRSLNSPAQTEVLIDNSRFHTYKGSTGLWVQLRKDGKDLEDKLLGFGAKLDDVVFLNDLDANKPVPTNRPIFIPYSESKRISLVGEGYGRDIVPTHPEELVWPVVSDKYQLLSSKLGRRWNKLHTGIDIAVPRNSLVIASADGEVAESSHLGNYGNTIIITHPEVNNIFTVYAHNSTLLVKKGDLVKKGQIIAYSGNTGHSTGPHVHFEVRYNNVVLNPEDFLPPLPAKGEELAIARETLIAID